MIRFSFVFALSICLLGRLTGQVAPPDPCTDGTQESCQCETSPVLCTIDDLDGFEFAMTNFLHPEDGPDELCQVNATPHNPSWFSFVAWCESLELSVEIENCSNMCRSGGPCTFLCAFIGNCTSGVQIAIFGDCEFNEVVACNVDECGNEDTKRLSMTGLEVGKTYYFVIDGCSGSACDLVRINVVGNCGRPIIEDWRNEIQGPQSWCVRDTVQFSADSLEGADRYHWYIDGVEVEVTNTPLFRYYQPLAGDYQLCVDASNERCIPVSDAPEQQCMRITVIDPTIQELNLSAPINCPGDTIVLVLDSLSANDALSSFIAITDLEGTVVALSNENSLRYSYPSCDSFYVYASRYFPSEVTEPEIGSSYTPPDCANACCAFEQDILVFRDDSPPEILDPPADLDIPCRNAIPPLTDLRFEDNCLSPGFITGIERGREELLDTGQFRRIWSISDQCNNVSSYQQLIRISESEPFDLSIEPDFAEMELGELRSVRVIPTIDEGAVEMVRWMPPINLGCPSCLVTTVTARENQLYTITVTDTFGCTASVNFELLLRNSDIEIYIPNTFTPNGDGINDGFTLFSNGQFKRITLMIYDRWGNRIFESANVLPNNTSSGWDGTFRSKDMNPGVYLYSFHIEYLDGDEEYLKGEISILR